MSYDPCLSAYAADHLSNSISGQTLPPPYRCGGYRPIVSDCDSFSPVGSGCSDNNRRPNVRRQVALNASTGSAGPLPIITTPLSGPLNVVSTTINTFGMGVTDNLLNFTSIITLPAGAVVTLNFIITRTATDGSTTNVGGTYTFATTAAVLGAQSFGFQFFDSNVAPGSYTYSVQLAPSSTVAVAAGVTVSNAVLSVLAVANNRC